MPIQSVVLFLISILLSALLLGFSFAIKSNNNARYLNYFFYYIICVVSYGFVNWIGPSFIIYLGEFSPTDTDTSHSTAAIILFIACAVPLVFIKLQLFFQFLSTLLNLPQHPRLTLTYYIVATSVSLVVFYLLSLDLNSQTLTHSRSFITLLGVLVLVASFICLFYFLSKIELLENKPLQNLARNFGWAYLLGYVIYASPFYLNYFMELSWYTGISPYIYYTMHLIPMFFLKKFSQLHQRNSVFEFSELQNLNHVKNFDISDREKTVLTLVLKGKSNNDIANQLCISANTVRNHIYNIYTKTHVKNRIQLQRLFSSENKI